MNMNSVGLQQNFILFVENKTKEANVNRRLCCEKCRFSTKDVELFERHVAHHKEVTFSCTLCSHVSYTRVESQRHSVTHKGSFPYRCNWCDYGAVRRDYMVKHIQRIHGKCADGGFITDHALPTTKVEQLSQKGTSDLCPDTSRKFVNCSTGKNSNRFLGISTSRAPAPYIVAKPVQPMASNKTHLLYSTADQSVTRRACLLPVNKPQIHSVPASSHVTTQFIQNINNQPSVSVGEVVHNEGKAEYINRPAEKMSLEKNASPSALPRIHFGIYADHSVQHRPLLQSQVKASAEKMVLQSKTVPKIPVGLPVGNNTHLKTILTSTLKSVDRRTAEAWNVTDASAGQRPVHSGAARNILVAHEVQHSVPSAAHPSIPVEQIEQGGLSFPNVTLNTEKPNRQKNHSNVLVKPPLEKFKSITQSSVQVELLAPLNQPIQHNRPLTVSCPEEITIPAGCLVELVEVKNISGTRELELRLVPQLPNGAPLGGTMSATTPGSAGRLSFKCRVTTEDDQQKRLDHEVCTTQENGIPKPQVKESCVKGTSRDITLTIKDEPEVNERVLWSQASVTQTSGSSTAGFPGVSKSVTKPASNPSESQKVIFQPSTTHRTVTNTTTLVGPELHMHSTVRTTSWRSPSKNVTTEALDGDLRAFQAAPNENDGAESYEGLPVISSVFSLCPIPEATLNHIHTKLGLLDKRAREALASSGSSLGSNGNVKNTDDLAVCSHDLKTEEETGALAKIFIKRNEKKPMTNEDDTNISEVTGSETLGDMLEKSSQTCANDLKDHLKIILEQCSILSDAQKTEVSEPALSNSFSTPINEEVKTKLELDNSLPVQRESSPALSMNPTVALVRIPSLEFYSVLESAKKISETLVEEESITARPVLCCTSNQQNQHDTAIKLVLKRKRSEAENQDSEQDFHPSLSHFDILNPHKKRKKGKKRLKKHKESKVRLDFHQIIQKGKMAKLWLSPLKEDQLVKLPGPNQPVVVLNHPNPLVQMVGPGVQSLKEYKWIATAHSFCQNKAQSIKQCPSFIMKLKKVQGQKYQVTEFVLKGVSEKMIL